LRYHPLFSTRNGTPPYFKYLNRDAYSCIKTM
jgi:hypothetical protein